MPDSQFYLCQESNFHPENEEPGVEKAKTLLKLPDSMSFKYSCNKNHEVVLWDAKQKCI